MMTAGMKATTTLAEVRPRDHQRYRDIPRFGRFLDDFVPWSAGCGYTRHTIYLQLDSVRHLAAWYLNNVPNTVRRLRAEDLAAASRYFFTRRSQGRYTSGLCAFGAFLESRGLLKQCRPKPISRTEREVNRFLDYLRKERGAADSTLDSYRRRLLNFLRFIGFERRKRVIQSITLATIHRYLRSLSGQHKRETMQHVVAMLRAFLRFQFMRGVIRHPLHDQIDSVRLHHEDHLPYPVQWRELQRLLQRIDRSTALGLRDFAVLLIAMTYGMRASDVASLSLDDVDWTKRTIRIVQCKTRHPLVLPLTDEVGDALADYLTHARPTSSFRQVFLRRQAPIAPLSLPAMANTLRRASHTAGVTLRAAGFRCLRHSLALRLLRQGTSAKAIGDILGHRSTTSTAVYLRLDVDDLRPAALPVPRVGRIEATGDRPQPVPSPRRRVAARTAPSQWDWSSFLKKHLADYLATQRSLGYGYRSQERILRGLDFFLASHYPGKRQFTLPMFEAWAAGLRSICPTTARIKMLCVRKFCRHLARAHPGTCIPDSRTFPKELPHPAPYLISGSEVARVLAATSRLRSTRSNPLHPQTIRMAIMLTFCCGLRAGEVRRLRLSDIDTEAMVLRINETKFSKSRVTPLSPSVASELRNYLVRRRRMQLPMEPEAPLVWNGWPRRNGRASALTNYPFWATWRRLCQFAQVWDHRGRPPRLHDMRHGFAVEALRRGYDAGMNAQAMLPRLARYMGHAGAQYTHYYLKFTEPLQSAASARFLHYSQVIQPSADPQKGGLP
jgi:integrase/recombinase XerD